MDKIKYKLHYPTEQYGFIEIEFEGSPDEAIEKYRELQGVWLSQAKEGLNPKEWRTLVDGYLKTGTMNPEQQELLERTNSAQSWFINELKKATKRICVT